MGGGVDIKSITIRKNHSGKVVEHVDEEYNTRTRTHKPIAGSQPSCSLTLKCQRGKSSTEHMHSGPHILPSCPQPCQEYSDSADDDSAGNGAPRRSVEVRAGKPNSALFSRALINAREIGIALWVKNAILLDTTGNQTFPPTLF
jgi:hypothetical protein